MLWTIGLDDRFPDFHEYIDSVLFLGRNVMLLKWHSNDDCVEHGRLILKEHDMPAN
jgi:hypothetical protein